MAYTPTEWKTGDLITADKLNKLEQGVQNEQEGPAGQNGADGAAAGFGQPTATVDENTGTPSVEITASGPDTAKIFSFKFKNLKGATGPTGPAGKDGKDAVLTSATKEAIGGVKMAAAVPDAAAAPTQEEFNALLAALRAAGIVSPS